jgi:hypothetical protein
MQQSDCKIRASVAIARLSMSARDSAIADAFRVHRNEFA